MSVSGYFVPLHRDSKPNRSNIMAGKINYIAPVDTVSGMFGKRSPFSGKGIISNVRRKASQNNPRGLMYFSVLTKTTYKPSAASLTWQETFKQICVGTHNRMIDPAHISADQAAFMQQSEYKTLYAYVWNQVRRELTE